MQSGTGSERRRARGRRSRKTLRATGRRLWCGSGADPQLTVLKASGIGGAFVFSELREQLQQRLRLAVPELTSRTVESLCPHELQHRVSRPTVWCVLLLGKPPPSAAESAEVPAWTPWTPPGEQGGIRRLATETAESALLLQNLAAVRKVAATLAARGVAGPHYEPVLDGKPVRFAWVDTHKQAELAGAIQRAAAKVAPKGWPLEEEEEEDEEDEEKEEELPLVVILSGRDFVVYPHSSPKLHAGELAKWITATNPKSERSLRM
eukprot:SAG22_NODE_25_length_30107_cov_28.456412_16_plen_264_part_00